MENWDVEGLSLDDMISELASLTEIDKDHVRERLDAVISRGCNLDVGSWAVRSVGDQRFDVSLIRPGMKDLLYSFRVVPCRVWDPESEEMVDSMTLNSADHGMKPECMQVGR